MRSLVAILLVLAYCEAKPSPQMAAVATLSPDSYILGGVDASPGEFPWQLSQQRQGTAAWSHSCGASLIKANYALSAAHCVDGANASILRVLAGLHIRSQPDSAITSNAQSYKMHEQYNTGAGSYPNDIAIITLVTAIPANGGSIQYASLPDNNNDAFVGRSLVISGWGRNSAANTLPDTLQKTTIGVISTTECNTRLSPVSGASATENMLCLYDTATSSGSCSGDSGGPANINYPSASDSRVVVAGITSWGIQSILGACLPSYPSIYTATGPYLGWIATNSP